ncbi:MAG: helix-turn-helix domain-containing protein [Propioniciclava sp.]
MIDPLVAAEVRAEMDRQRQTVTGLAACLGIRRITLAARIRGIVPFRASELHAVASALGTSASCILATVETHLTPPMDRNHGTL